MLKGDNRKLHQFILLPGEPAQMTVDELVKDLNRLMPVDVEPLDNLYV